ncbi:MAG: glycosyltransferase [bacterium]|nr:glycosyltransferase [bacterium]
MKILTRWLRALPLLLISPILFFVPIATLVVSDLLFLISGRPRRAPQNRRPRTNAASVVIPNWNGRDLLEEYLPSVVAALAGNPQNEIIVVDNGSDDGSAEFLRSHFPEVHLLALEENLGFGGGSNAGVEAASNDIVVLLNSDMRVEPDFLPPLLDGFTDEQVFAVACQIFFSDPNKKREETGLTEGWWSDGGLRVRHREDNGVDRLFPCFYGGGGSCAVNRTKFLDIGGFDRLLAPFYLEDTDLGYMAWKRNWKVLYEPRSKVYHEHRGTIGKKFTEQQIQAVLKKNFILFCWKNIHEWRRLASHFCHTFTGSILSLVFGDSPERASLAGAWRSFHQLPGAIGSRWNARKLAVVNDTEAFRRPMAAYFRDRFSPLPQNPARPRVLFVSPYPICPPVHGGGVFMLQTCEHLAELVDLHLIVLLDKPEEQAAHAELVARCGSAEFLVRMEGRPKALGSIVPFAIREFDNPDLRWLIHRETYLREIDVIQLEYFTMAQYAGAFHRLACTLFEHDVYFQSVGRVLRNTRGLVSKPRVAIEYMRALRTELKLLPLMDRVQVCSTENASCILGFLPDMKDKLDADQRAGIDVPKYSFVANNREPFTILFIGSFRHLPNQEALNWFLREVFPRVRAVCPRAKLVVVGSEPPARHSLPSPESVELLGSVKDIREPLSRYAVFACPILTGSGVRVKLLEAFAAGIPAVSTHLGAEGLTSTDGDICSLADDPAAFAAKIVDLLEHPDISHKMAARARRYVEKERDMEVLTKRLAGAYRNLIQQKRTVGIPPGSA